MRPARMRMRLEQDERMNGRTGDERMANGERSQELAAVQYAAAGNIKIS